MCVEGCWIGREGCSKAIEMMERGWCGEQVGISSIGEGWERSGGQRGRGRHGLACLCVCVIVSVSLLCNDQVRDKHPSLHTLSPQHKRHTNNSFTHLQACKQVVHVERASLDAGDDVCSRLDAGWQDVAQRMRLLSSLCPLLLDGKLLVGCVCVCVHVQVISSILFDIRSSGSQIVQSLSAYPLTHIHAHMTHTPSAPQSAASPS